MDPHDVSPTCSTNLNRLDVQFCHHRCFPTKAISLWTATDDATHAYIVGAYFHYSVPGGWTAPKAVDIGASKGGGLFGGSSDPMYVVYARKEA